MKKKLLPVLICPSCLPNEYPLAEHIEEELGEDIVQGLLSCQECGGAYPIRNGVAFLDPASAGEKGTQSRYESPRVLSSYLWSHFGDLLGDAEASDAYARWAGLMEGTSGMCLDMGCAVGRFAFEMSLNSDFVVGLDNSATFIQTARELMLHRELRFSLVQEGLLTREVALQLPEAWKMDRVELIVGNALALPFRSRSFTALAGLNLVDKVPVPLKHFAEMNRTAMAEDAQFLFSDPFSWSGDAAKEEDWLGGKETGPYPGRGMDNVIALLKGEGGRLVPGWKIQQTGHVWWKIRTHCNHFELIRSQFIKAVR
ncbi:Trm112 family protein [Desulforhabdus sp. TSK]|uniref:class I SAM-dependent methyltransferase n=1 Tax=Desulforhabdus sp. TSK TaxID=2925014 RepID=UPI001FC8DCBB|nr:Trm112 family protein [Desulforhabdus sp. TSK]GKT06831.1 SAM-dependent methyltransferase [Desulforhabdus sp. TSK]